MMITTWRKEILEALSIYGEAWADIVATTLTEEELDREFDKGSGITEGIPFTLWTANRVYFPAGYDGAECCVSVPRNPSGEKTRHNALPINSY